MGGEDWTGGSLHTISWNASDPEDPPWALTIDLYSSQDNGSTWVAIVLGLGGSNSTYSWTVPPIDSSTVRVRVCVTDTGNLTSCDLSGPFTIDSTPPQVNGTDPQDGATNVSTMTAISVYWDEPMDSAAANASFAITPPVAGTLVWPSATTLVFTPTVPLALCTTYIVDLSGFEDDSDPGNEQVPHMFAFSTVCPSPPSVALSRPVGGEYWAGGSTERVEWTGADSETSPANLTFYLNYTSSAGSGPIAGPLLGAFSYDWTVPILDTSDAVVNITIIDEDAMMDWDESGPFTIDSTPPTLASFTPIGWNVPAGSEIVAVFSEPVNAMLNYTTESFGLQDEDTGSWLSVTWTRVPPTMWPTEIRFVPTPPLPLCGNYRAYVNDTFFDRAVWSLANPTSWTFHTLCEPTVTLLAPTGGEDWTGGTPHDVVWTLTDEVDVSLSVWVNYSLDGGADGFPYPVIGGTWPVGTTAYSWTLPIVDSDQVRLRITALDSSGLIGTAESGDFTIDSTAPTILTSVPFDGATGVKTKPVPPLQVVFDEPVDRASAVQAFSIVPNPGGVTLSWTTTADGQDILVINHDPLKSKTDYLITFSTDLKDDSDPGNHATAPLTIAFTTKPPPDVIPPVALAVGKRQVQVGEPVTLDGSGSTGNITRYVWTIQDNQGWIVAVREGETATYTFQKNGRYSVTLTVSGPGGNDYDTLEIVVTSNPNALLALAGAAALVGALLVGGTEAGRVGFLTLLLAPVYRRKLKGKTDPETRGMIRGYIRVHPGDTYTDIKRNLGLNNGTLTWHLLKLKKEGVIKTRTQGPRKRYYPAEMPLPADNGSELHEVQMQLLKAVRAAPGLRVSDLAAETGVSSQLALYHLRKMSQKGLVSLERRGVRLRAYPPKDWET